MPVNPVDAISLSAFFRRAVSSAVSPVCIRMGMTFEGSFGLRPRPVMVAFSIYFRAGSDEMRRKPRHSPSTNSLSQVNVVSPEPKSQKIVVGCLMI